MNRKAKKKRENGKTMWNGKFKKFSVKSEVQMIKAVGRENK